ncbi:MAG TPA: hypothetical protein VFV67_17520 [Actinophytocola sp.]|uniref:hypothetical protein n=1 Tax=Actinophytocola sp. TaxID=1872138 RepID=UPI002DB98710|nr:hypothetical protein [Actinophytocola sp.]HEU5472455.1 hypothetical protein [Actinophytocola sp.]
MDQEPVGVVVSVADDHLDGLDEVVAGLRDAGMRVDGVLEPLGVVTGTVEEAALPNLGSVPGVAEVERQRGPGVPPPDSEVQ